MTNKRQTLALRAIEGELLPEEETYQAKLREAVFNGVNESDVTEVVKSITARAKAGDKQATREFFDYVLGGKRTPSKIVVHNHFESPEQGARIVGAKRSHAG